MDKQKVIDLVMSEIGEGYLAFDLDENEGLVSVYFNNSYLMDIPVLDYFNYEEHAASKIISALGY